MTKRSRKEKPPRSMTRPYPAGNINFLYNLPIAIFGIGLLLATLFIILLKVLGY